MTSDPWATDDNDFPGRGSDGDKLRFAVNYAVLAASGHNTQHWLFRIAGDHLDVLADRRRCLAVVDPHDRTLIITCGAALAHLAVALRRFGYVAEIETFPEPANEDCLARVRLGARRTRQPRPGAVRSDPRAAH